MPSSTQFKDFRYEDFLPAQLQGLSVAVNRLVATELERQHDLSLNEWRVLAHVAVNPGTTAQSVAAIAVVDKGWVSRSVRKLLDRGVLQAERSTRDSRKVLLEATEQGVAVFDAAAADIRSLQNKLLDALSAEDHESYIRLTARLARAASTLDTRTRR